jgi:hypothetical protein
MYDYFLIPLAIYRKVGTGLGVADVFLNNDQDRYNATVASINDIPGLALKATLPI